MNIYDEQFLNSNIIIPTYIKYICITKKDEKLFIQEMTRIYLILHNNIMNMTRNMKRDKINVPLIPLLIQYYNNIIFSSIWAFNTFNILK